MPNLRSPNSKTGERGAVLVEFALIAPLLIALLFGIVEFGWAFFQVLDTRHGAREGARLAAVDYSNGGLEGNDQRDLLIAETCGRLENPALTRVTLSFDVAGSEDVGDLASIRVERDLEQVTGFFDPLLGGLTQSSEVTFRLEQDASWTATSGQQTCP